MQERDDPHRPERGEVGVRISYTGICGSDIHGYTGDNGRRAAGQVMGHETVGRVYAVGEGVSDVAIGQIVTFNPLISCGQCEACRSGVEQHCADSVVIGVQAHTIAAFAEKVVVPAANVVGLDRVSDERHGALVEPLAVALHAARRAGVKKGDTVLVTGGGPIGQSAILAAQRMGAARVVATDISRARRELCQKLHAEVIDPAAAPTADQVRALLGGPVDVTLDAVGVSATLADALSSTRLGGTVGLVGMGSPEVTLPAYAISTQERTIVGSFCYDAQTFRDAGAWVGEGHGVFDELISDVVSLGEADATFAHLAGAADVPGKVLVELKQP
ncbi:alcohol dehydrogenase catalytic domain-containing protein [Georgenia sp. TF02-10]|uniref:zinc-dependent alcohol dehydrogenase n=1 Tax=Georgenia sp. TF02-10 TaxID=2917725 RepID=UPI001FA7FFA8|nr:alcohol dehydrogenase catalytic domain-containing protein [Georgenia sp. TF02-10]UNX54301.1 alcohol dehydrogenase catalytic domain-containing protein [Georgenia sp. TF02-10]